MRRYVAIVAAIWAVLLTIFAVVQLLDVELLVDPSDSLERGGPVVAFIAVGLLTVDAVLPVPSSIVMISLGAAYGIIVGGVLAAVGSVLAAVLAFAIGRCAEGSLHRVASERDRAAFARWFSARGDLALIVSRPIPIVAETVAALAGTTTMRPRRFVALVTLGAAPAALAYAATGSAVAQLDNAVLIAAGVVAVAGTFWLVGTMVHRHVVTSAHTDNDFGSTMGDELT